MASLPSLSLRRANDTLTSTNLSMSECDSTVTLRSTTASHVLLLTPVDSTAVLEEEEERRSSRMTMEKATSTPAMHQLHVLMNLLMSAIGAGILSLPFTFAVVPTFQAIVMVCAIGLSMALTSHAMVCAHVSVAAAEERATFVGAGRHSASYRTLATQVAGERFGTAVALVLAIGTFGGCVGCVRIVSDMVPHVTQVVYSVFTTSARYATLPDTAQSIVETEVLWGLFLFIVFPLCSVKRLSGLQVTNYMGFAFSLLLVGATIYRACNTKDDLMPAVQPTLPPVIVVATTTTASFQRLAQIVCIFSYAFTTHLNILPLFVQLRGTFEEPLQQSHVRMKQCIATVMVVCVVLYGVFGYVAAHLYRTHTHGNVLINMQRDSLMQVPLFAVFITVLFSFPALFHPGRDIIQELVFQCPPSQVAWKTRVCVAALLLMSEMLVAIWAPGIDVVFALVGATTTVLLCYAFPVVMFTTLYPWQRSVSTKVWCLVLWVIVLWVAIMGGSAVVFLLSKKR